VLASQQRCVAVMTMALLDFDPFPVIQTDDSNFTQSYEVETLDAFGSLDSSPTPGCYTLSAQQCTNAGLWLHFGSNETPSLMSPSEPSVSDDRALSRSASLVSSSWHTGLALPGDVSPQCTLAQQHAGSQWLCCNHSAVPSADRTPSAINAAIEQVLQMPRVQLQREPLPLGLKLDAAAVLAQLHQTGGSVKAACKRSR